MTTNSIPLADVAGQFDQATPGTPGHFVVAAPDADVVDAEFVIAGFVDVKVSPAGEGVFAVTATRPAEDFVGALTLKDRQAVTATADEEEDLIDESTLLEEQDYDAPAAAAEEDSCGPAVMRACADCSCGFADELARIKAEDSGATDAFKPTILDAKTGKAAMPVANSSCGSCNLGDAFRCAGCPYRGLPAFRDGETVVLDLGDDI
ncbi:hypothetical protein H696_02420 [Fonticula alba]|uniref:Anamorsin C-terminal domain-containing protein n=1 Tax=Fonticula alba TaxID=691883 RepID=A0A058ZAQ3_FONAL|nr:hypothetical protein H696_02420 [Fonticula alba]KCV71474.1 hypothetical protein H696_02420 [Fonticula alba]|eukprot:XP_009494597.1 hypothetical protein H696_02420 [Fonticula alba]